MKNIKLVDRKKDTARSSQSCISLEFESITFGGLPHHSKLQFYMRIQDGGPQHQHQLKCQTKAVHGQTLEGTTEFQWQIDKTFAFTTSLVSITIFKQQRVWVNHLIAVALVPVNDILTHLLQNPDTALNISLHPGYTVSMTIKQTSLHIFKEIQLSHMVIKNFEEVEGLFKRLISTTASTLSELSPLVESVTQLLSNLHDKLQDNSLALSQLTELIKMMDDILHLFDQVQALANTSSNCKLVVRSLLVCLKEVLAVVIIPYNQADSTPVWKRLYESANSVAQCLLKLKQAMYNVGKALNLESQISETTDANKLLNLLNPVSYISAPLCLVGTRREILQQLQSWTQTDGSRLFWLYGQAGTGKSAIAQSMFSWLKQEDVLCALYTCTLCN
ncbi:hypothetical protein BDN72DRAFT_963611 [Pluteus cervinus]|uniref:Uncharacterized protein n=1 Tax=Pluteus cervinus TaxID=181527 RepID=A0ACD3AE05_9AGAR|nr:hypothetical protein BDN72DRAFT_963611 [Pluteus cervinus]